MTCGNCHHKNDEFIICQKCEAKNSLRNNSCSKCKNIFYPEDGPITVVNSTILNQHRPSDVRISGHCHSTSQLRNNPTFPSATTGSVPTSLSQLFIATAPITTNGPNIPYIPPLTNHGSVLNRLTDATSPISPTNIQSHNLHLPFSSQPNNNQNGIERSPSNSTINYPRQPTAQNYPNVRFN
jgi:hypothetical protein